MLYKLTRGTVSTIRKDAVGVLEAQNAGYILQGECDQDGNITGPASLPKLQAPQETNPPVKNTSKGKR